MILTCTYWGERCFEHWKFRGFPPFLQIDGGTVYLLANKSWPSVVKVLSSRCSCSIYLLIVSHITAAVEASSLHNLRISPLDGKFNVSTNSHYTSIFSAPVIMNYLRVHDKTWQQMSVVYFTLIFTWYWQSAPARLFCKVVHFTGMNCDQMV